MHRLKAHKTTALKTGCSIIAHQRQEARSQKLRHEHDAKGFNFFHLRICKGAEAATGSSSRPWRGSVWLAELLAEARGVAAEFAGDVCAVAFRPDGAAVRHRFLGVAREAPTVGRIRRPVARDMSAMGLREVAEHERQLQ